MQHLLEDITVIDAASYLAGPGAATIMADFGANVIKIEPPGGDGYRQLVGRYPVPYHWQLTSRNKRSLALDLSKDAGQQVLKRLVAEADVLTTNFLAHQLAKFGLEYDRLKQINPRLIFAHISGYGLHGPEANRRAFDVTAWWARSGIMEFIREPGQTPLAAAPGMGDHSTAAAFFGAIMTGLYRREKTGEGSFVSTSLAANGVWANGMAIQGVIAGNDIGEYRQEKGWHNPLTSAYACKDGRYIVFAVINTEREYPRLAEALERTEWLQDERFSDVGRFMRHRTEFIEALGEAVAQFDYAEVAARLDRFDITYGPVQPMAGVLEDEQLRANGVVVETGDPGEDYPLTIGSPIQVREAPKKPPQRAPDIGQHSAEILSEFGYHADEIQQLLDQQVIFAPT